MPGQVPLAVGDPVPAALAVPPLRLRRVSCYGSPVSLPALPADRPDGQTGPPTGRLLTDYRCMPCATTASPAPTGQQSDDGEQHAES